MFNPHMNIPTRLAPGLALLYALSTADPQPLLAQCPDGTPPPCATARRSAQRRAAPAAEQRARRFLVLPFRNVTQAEAQEWLVAGAPLILTEALSQFQDLVVVSEAQLLAARRRLSLADIAPDATQLRRLAEETGGWTVVNGNVVASGGRVRLSAQAIDAVTGNILKSAQAEIAADADVRPAFDRLVLGLLEVPGLPPQVSDVAALSTRSVDAYRAYVRGVELLHRSAFKPAKEALVEAVRLDPTFAMAWARLALAGAAWNMAELVNPMSQSYVAANRAASLAGRLPPREAALIRALAHFFGGRLGAGMALADSLLRADPDDLDAREFIALCSMLDPVLDSSAGAARPRLRTNWNRVVREAREVLERDPGRRYAYSALGFVYGVAGGMWPFAIDGVQREGASFAATFMAPTVVRFIPVLRDSLELLPKAVYDSLPEAERLALRQRALDAMGQWMMRWLAAGPEDTDAHLFASRFYELKGDVPAALAEAEAALRLGVESPLEPAAGRVIMLRVRAGQVASAAALTDSLLRAGAWRRPFLPALDRGWSFGVAALMLNRQFARAVELASLFHRPAAGEARCAQLWEFFDPAKPPALPADVARAAAQTAVQFGLAEPELAPCADGLRRAASQ